MLFLLQIVLLGISCAVLFGTFIFLEFKLKLIYNTLRCLYLKKKNPDPDFEMQTLGKTKTEDKEDKEDQSQNKTEEGLLYPALASAPAPDLISIQAELDKTKEANYTLTSALARHMDPSQNRMLVA